MPAIHGLTRDGSTYTLRGEGDDFVTAVIGAIARSGIRVRGFRTETPTLEALFLEAHGPRDQGLTNDQGALEAELDRDQGLPQGTAEHVGSLGAPVVMFVAFGTMFRSGAAHATPVDRAPFNVAILAALVVALGAVQSLIAIIAIYREGGILKRLRATPLSPVTILGAHVLVKLVFTVIGLGLLVLAGRRVAPGAMPANLLSVTAAFLLSTLSILSLGFVLASIVPTARFAQPLGAAILYPMIALSGLFFPLDRLPAWLRYASCPALPTTHAVSLMQGVLDGGGWGAHLGSVAGLLLVFGACTLLRDGGVSLGVTSCPPRTPGWARVGLTGAGPVRSARRWRSCGRNRRLRTTGLRTRRARRPCAGRPRR